MNTSAPARPRFLADNNVGRLGRWLRALGYDAAYRPLLSDAELVRAALAEGRVLLTRDEDLMNRRAVASGLVRAIFLRSDSVEAQVAQVDHDLALDRTLVMTRCLECNLALEPRPLDRVGDRVPPYVRATQTRFSECPGCRRVYWAGTHCARMNARFAALVAAA